MSLTRMTLVRLNRLRSKLLLFVMLGTVMIASPISILSKASSPEIETNGAQVINPPRWMTSYRVEAVIDRIQSFLEWDLRKVKVSWHDDPILFQRLHGLGPSVLAYSLKSENVIHIGPQVSTTNFDGVFGHELVHIILYQKYKDAVPKWLEEGLANYAAKQGKVDYVYLKRALTDHAQFDIHQMVHPFSATGAQQQADPTFHYQVSTALMEMIASKCDVHSLLQLSVGKKLETYLVNTCQITDLNGSLKQWVNSKAPHGSLGLPSHPPGH